MSRHIIQAADGSRHIVEIPDGVSNDEVIKAERKRLLAEAAKEGGLLANLGAGFDNVWQGAKQLMGKGDDDATIQERRRLKENLAENVTGGGLAQLAGEMLGSAPLTGGVSGAVGKGVVKLLPKAAEWAMKGGRVANLGLVGDAAVQGAGSGALTETTSDESKALNTGLGATIGAVLPGALVGTNAARKGLNKVNAPTRAAKLFEEKFGPEGIRDIQDALHSPANQSSLPLSTAAMAQDTKLAAMERGARQRQDWGLEHDRNVNRAAWDNLKAATSDADELSARVADREAMMRASKEDLADAFDPARMKSSQQSLSDAAEELRHTAEARQSFDATALISQTEGMLLHPDVTPKDFAVQWFNLNKKIQSDKFTPDERGVLLKLRDAIQQAGDDAAGGPAFTDMLGRYLSEEGRVGQSQASQAIRDVFMSPEGVIKTGRADFDTPVVTSSVLRKTMASKGEGASGDLLAPTARDQLNTLSKDLSRHELQQAANSPGPTQLGIDNPMSAFTNWRTHLTGAGAKTLGNWLFKGSKQATTDAVDRALLNPAEWQRLMEDYAVTRTPLSPGEYAERMKRALLMAPSRAATAELGED